MKADKEKINYEDAWLIGYTEALDIGGIPTGYLKKTLRERLKIKWPKKDH